MKISESKQELARIISENGGWRDAAEWSAQDKDWRVSYFDESEKPVRPAGKDEWWAKGYIRLARIKAEKLLPLWHSTLLSRAEYFHLYPAPDADGWIEWKGGECPVGGDVMVVCKVRTGKEFRNGKKIKASILRWRHTGGMADIIAYRLHKPEQAKPEFCESVARSIPEPEINNKNINITQVDDIGVVESKPTIEQLAADYRNKLDYANRKQDEADKANMESDAALSELDAAIAAIGFAITPLVDTKQELELAITDWRDLQVGDVVTITGSENSAWGRLRDLGVVVVSVGDTYDYLDFKSECGLEWTHSGNTEFKFIRRP